MQIVKNSSAWKCNSIGFVFSRSGTKNSIFDCGEDSQGSSCRCWANRRVGIGSVGGPFPPESGPSVHSGLPLRPAVHPAAGTRSRSGLRLGWDGPVQVLRRGVPRHHVQPRLDSSQPAAQRPTPSAGRGAVAPHALLQAHPARGHGLPGQLPPLAQGGEAVGRWLQLRGLE